MSNLVETIESEALTLPLEERKRLALHLLESIESRPVSEPMKVEVAWVAESNRRYEAYLRGEERAIPAEDIFAELREEDH